MYQSSHCFLWPSPLLEPNREISCSQPKLLLNIVLLSEMKMLGPHTKNLYRVVEQWQQGVQLVVPLLQTMTATREAVCNFVN